MGATHVLETAAEIPPARKSFMKATGSARDILFGFFFLVAFRLGTERRVGQRLCPGVNGPRTDLQVNEDRAKR